MTEMTATTEAWIWRGIRVKLPAEVHAIVHGDDARAAGTALADWLAGHPLGWHWTTSHRVAATFADGRNFWARLDCPDSPDVTEVIIRAADPGREAVMSPREAEALDSSSVVVAVDEEISVSQGHPVDVQLLWWRPSGSREDYRYTRVRPRGWAA